MAGYIKPYSPSGAAFSAFGDMLMQFLMQQYNLKQVKGDREADRAQRDKEFASTQANENRRLDLEYQRMTDEKSFRDMQARIQNAGIAAGQAQQNPGTLDPAQASMLEELLKGTPYAALIKKTGEAGTLPSTQITPGATSSVDDPFSGARRTMDPGGVVSSVLPTFAQREQQDTLQMQKKQLDSQEATAELTRRHLAGEETDPEKQADEMARLAKEHEYRLSEITAQLNAGKKTSMDEDVKQVASAYTAAAKYRDIDPDEAAKLQNLGDMLATVAEKKWGISLKAKTPAGDGGPGALPPKVQIPGSPEARSTTGDDILKFLVQTPDNPLSGSPYLLNKGQDALGRLLQSAKSSIMDCDKNDPRYLTDPSFCKPHIEPAK